MAVPGDADRKGNETTSQKQPILSNVEEDGSAAADERAVSQMKCDTLNFICEAFQFGSEMVC